MWNRKLFGHLILSLFKNWVGWWIVIVMHRWWGNTCCTGTKSCADEETTWNFKVNIDCLFKSVIIVCHCHLRVRGKGYTVHRPSNDKMFTTISSFVSISQRVGIDHWLINARGQSERITVKIETKMESKIERVKSKNLFNFPPQGYYDEDLKGRLSSSHGYQM